VGILGILRARTAPDSRVSRETNIGTGTDTSAPAQRLSAEASKILMSAMDDLAARNNTLCAHVEADHETLRALWALAGKWEAEAGAIEARALAHPWWDRAHSHAHAKDLRARAAELRDVAAGRSA